MTRKSARHQPLFERIAFRGNPRANPDGIVVRGNARFTMLTTRLLRMEWSENGEFEDRGTYAFPTRFAPAVHFTTRIENDVLFIDTGALTLRYGQCPSASPFGGRGFSADNLSIAFERNGDRQIWVPGLEDPSNLRGTRRTLDRCQGDAALEEGLLSRAGWSLFDDSNSVLFDPDDGWPVPRPAHKVQDWYFFVYGRDYKGALTEYIRFGGAIALIPRYVLGAWWSRYWAYNDQELRQLVRSFEEHDLPLDVLVIDMDWHTPHAWTGYTWNRELFPDPPDFLKWVHDKGLRVTLNLHPAEGIQSFEEVYPRFALAMGMDPDRQEGIPFHITDREFVRNYLELLHHPLEDDGVDFWWVDWQQGKSSEMAGLDPLLWLNHLHYSDSTRRGLRPLIFSRWSGLGNHRYPMGFSGDTYVGWPALQFQPYFSATSSNVAFGWWGHDIGGHMGDPTDPELYARWVQFGALSPCLRLHATKDPRLERRPWKYPPPVYQAAKAAFHWRYQLVPYVYTMARIAHDTGVALCRPMYYEYPQEDAAYTARYQYFFGDQMIAAPIVHPADPQTGLATTDVWVPEGTWIDYATKETFTGPGWVRLVGDLSRVPMLMRAGAILPLAAPFEAQMPGGMTSGTTDAIPHDKLVLSVFPGDRGRFCLYEDDGITEAHVKGQYEWTEVKTRMDHPDIWEVHIEPVAGLCEVLPKQRGYEVRLEGSRHPNKVMLDGIEFSDWCYEPETLTTVVPVPLRDKRQPVTITAQAEHRISALGTDHNCRVILADVKRLLGDQCPDDEDVEGSLDAVLHIGSPGQAHAIARLGGPLVHFLEYTTPEEAACSLGRIIIGSPTHCDPTFDFEATWTLFQGWEARQQTTQVQGAARSQILEAPFAFDGQVRTMYWTAEVKLTWRAKTMTYTHRSSLLFPTIYAWRALVFNQDEQPIALVQVLDNEGNPNEELNWTNHDQATEGLINVNQAHGVYLSKEYRQELEANTPLAAYLASTIISSDEREAILWFRSAGPVDFYLNGQKVEEVPVEQDEPLPALLHRARRTAPLHLHPGRNSLVIHTVPPEEKRQRWYFGGMFVEPDGEPVSDLAFESRPCPADQ